VSVSLFDPWTMGPFKLANRIVMAPMTRNRADDAGVPSIHAVEYYRQRAGAGLLISEATQPSEGGRGYAGTPGIHSQDQQNAWHLVADAVHRQGGLIFCQLMHTGRIGHTSLLPPPLTLVAPSAIRADIDVTNADGVDVPAETPRALETDEIRGIIEDFASASERAVAAGLDGIELHGANGYLPHQFLSPATNVREDEYGGSPEGRTRFVVDLTREVASRIGPDRVGLRLSPAGKFNDMHDTDNEATYLSLVDQLSPMRIAYLHVLRRRSTLLHLEMRRRWSTTFVLNTGYHGSSQKEDLQEVLTSGGADLVSVGRHFISNPDLVERWRQGVPMAPWDEDLFYKGGECGYIDYPSATRMKGTEMHASNCRISDLEENHG
jgi:N-ethylmaleimide reductase